MWQLTNTTPFEAYQGFDRDKHGNSYWAVWIKVTVQLRDGRPPLFVKEQVPIFKEAQFAGEPNLSELFCDNEVELAKPNTEIVASGYIKPSKPILNEYTAAITLGDWRKDVKIVPACVWDEDGEAIIDEEKSALPFSIGYESAFGGIGIEKEATSNENNIGLGYLREGDDFEGKYLPRLIASDQSMPKPYQMIDSISFGSIQRGWLPRRQHVGTYDANWKRNKSPLLPDDFNELFFQETSQDQWINAELKGGEKLEFTDFFEGPNRENSSFVTELPSFDFELITKFKGSWVEMPPKLQKIQVIPHKKLMTLSYVGQMPILCANNDVKIEESILRLVGSDHFRVLPSDADAFDYFTNRVLN